MSLNGEDDLIHQVMEITACLPDMAKQLLTACSNNVEAAVALFFEQGPDVIEVPTNEVAAGGSIGADAITDLTDDVRAPDAPFREQLIDPENDNFFIGRPPIRTYHQTQRVKVCPLRDFAREAALMEQQLESTGEYVPNIENGAANYGRQRAVDMVNAAVTTSVAKESRLVDLFRPPTDLIYAGTFQIARKHATNTNMWLLVNIQSDNFNSHVLNRDVWSDKKLRLLIRRHFVLWQVDQDSGEGRRFTAFYKCDDFPYVCVIDPRTGEEVLKIHAPNQKNVLPALQKFLNEHRDFALDERPSTSKRSMPMLIDSDDDDDDVIAASSSSFSRTSNQNPSRKRAKLMELSEEEQMAMAIRNSMCENGNSASSTSSSSNSTSKPLESSTNGKATYLSNKSLTTSTRNGNTSSAQNNIKSYVIDDDDSMDSNLSNLSEYEPSSAAAPPPVVAATKVSYEDCLGKSKEFSLIKLRLLNEKGEEEVIQLKWPSDTICLALRAYVCQMYPHVPAKDQNFKIICAFPKTSLQEDTNNSTLKELGLYPSAYLHVTLD